MRDCVTRLLEMGAEAFPDNFTWRKALHMIAIGFHEDGKTPDEMKNALVNWARETRNLSPSEERNQVVDFVDWLYRLDEVAIISCAPRATMVKHDWCVGAKQCEWKREQRVKVNASRSGPFDSSLWLKWRGYLIRQYRNGVYVAAAYDALRARWLSHNLVDQQPVFIGCRELAEEVYRIVDHKAPKRSTEDHRMAALRWAHVLGDEGLIRISLKGTHAPRRGKFFPSNGYVLLPMPPVPDEGCGVAATPPDSTPH